MLLSSGIWTKSRLENEDDLEQAYKLTSKTRIYKVAYMWYAYSLGFSQLAACTLDKAWN